MLLRFLLDHRQSPELLASGWPVKMTGMGVKPGEYSGKLDRVASGARSGTMGKMTWVWLEPSSEEADDLAQHYPEMAKSPVDKVGGETELWMATGLLIKLLGQRVMAESAAWEFCLRAGLKGEVSSFNLKHSFLLFHFQEKEESDIVLQ